MDSLNDISYTLSTRRQPLSHRAYCIAAESDPLELSRINKSAERPNLIFTFTGQGAQWARMGKELFSQEPLFKNSIKRLDKVLSSLPEPPQWSLKGILFTRGKPWFLFTDPPRRDFEAEV